MVRCFNSNGRFVASCHTQRLQIWQMAESFIRNLWLLQFDVFEDCKFKRWRIASSVIVGWGNPAIYKCCKFDKWRNASLVIVDWLHWDIFDKWRNASSLFVRCWQHLMFKYIAVNWTKPTVVKPMAKHRMCRVALLVATALTCSHDVPRVWGIPLLMNNLL